MRIDSERYPSCYYEDNHHIHSANIIEEDSEYYYVVPYKAIRAFKKDEVHLDLKALLKTNLKRRIKERYKISKHRYKEMTQEILAELVEEIPEYFI